LPQHSITTRNIYNTGVRIRVRIGGGEYDRGERNLWIVVRINYIERIALKTLDALWALDALDALSALDENPTSIKPGRPTPNIYVSIIQGDIGVARFYRGTGGIRIPRDVGSCLQCPQES
jgi:hypothetical protein